MKKKPDYSKPLPSDFIKNYSRNSVRGAEIKKYFSDLGRLYFISTFTKRRKKFKPKQI